MVNAVKAVVQAVPMMVRAVAEVSMTAEARGGAADVP